MADFQTAINWLREGKKVRRPTWLEDSYWILGVDESIQWMNKKVAHIHLNQIEANDWEIFKEENNFKYFKQKCICHWSKDDEYGFIPNVNCPVHGKQTKKMLGKCVPYEEIKND